MNPEHITVEMCRSEALDYRRGLTSELDEMWSFVQSKANPRWLWHAMVVYPTAAENSLVPQTRSNAPSHHVWSGGNVMVSHLFYYQLALVALVWLFVMLHGAESRREAPIPPTATPSKPKSKRSRLLVDSMVVDVPRSSNPTFVIRPFWKSLLFNGLKNEWRFSDNVGA